MASFTPEQWFVLGLVGAAGVLAILTAIAGHIRNDLVVLEHAAECSRLRSRHMQTMKQARAQAGAESDDVEIL